ncbi:MAG TPA: ATP-binding protein [Candidatus Thermoplasmatota archaeon]|nr:ATP-binding protein [Candidatus Thermoplasmatota archaeon]
MALVNKKEYRKLDKKRFYSLWFFRILLLILIALELTSNRSTFQFFYTIVFLLSFAPSIIRRTLSISLPLPFELLYILSLFTAVLGEKIFSGLLVQFILGIFFGIFGFLLMYILYYNSRIQTSPILITAFSFSFSVATGAIWTVFVFLLQTIPKIQFDTISINYAPIGLLFTIIGASVVSTAEYLYLTYGEGKIFQGLLKAFMKKNPDLFIETDITPKKIQKIIEKEESEQLEFKSSLRTNLHTKKPDKKIELAVLKTITAFLNTDGGTLLIGVADDGKIVGINQDGFSNNDKFYQHYTNLIQNHIGNEYLPIIKSKLVHMDEKKTILKVDCMKSHKPVFLNMNNDEYFFVRIGPASVKLSDKKLIEYVKRKF